METWGSNLNVGAGGCSYLTHNGFKQDGNFSFPSSFSSVTSPYTSTLQVSVVVDHFHDLGYFARRFGEFFGSICLLPSAPFPPVEGRLFFPYES